MAGYPCRGELHSPPRHPAGMNDCLRIGAHITKRLCRCCVVVSHTATTLRRWCMVISHTATTLCRCCMVISHTATTLRRWCMILSHTATTLRRCCMVVSHTATGLRRCCIVVSHTATRHAMGRMLLRPYPGTRHSCTWPNSQASVDAPANLAGIPDAPGKLRRRP